MCRSKDGRGHRRHPDSRGASDDQVRARAGGSVSFLRRISGVPTARWFLRFRSSQLACDWPSFSTTARCASRTIASVTARARSSKTSGTAKSPCSRTSASTPPRKRKRCRLRARAWGVVHWRTSMTRLAPLTAPMRLSARCLSLIEERAAGFLMQRELEVLRQAPQRCSAPIRRGARRRQGQRQDQA